MTNKIFKEFGENPLELFGEWFGEASKSEASDPNAMALATAGGDGRPSVRMVLMKSFDARGFTFFTNYQSEKGLALQVNPRAELNFHWKSLERQIRISGSAEKISGKESSEYFAARDRNSQLGAWASSQTRPLEDYADFEKELQAMEQKFAGQTIPRPPYWGGFRVKPERMEFWMARPHRLHKRFAYTKDGNGWNAGWLFP